LLPTLPVSEVKKTLQGPRFKLIAEGYHIDFSWILTRLLLIYCLDRSFKSTKKSCYKSPICQKTRFFILLPTLPVSEVKKALQGPRFNLIGGTNHVGFSWILTRLLLIYCLVEKSSKT
jgi:hypothetical protein